MNKRLTIILTLMLLASAVSAHRLNEYLVASTITVSHSIISIEMRLTPGVAVAGEILKDIDLDNDNLISEEEKQIYLTRISADLSFNMDNAATALKIVSYSFPTVEAMRKGSGEILIAFEANWKTQSSLHQLQLKNRHFNNIAVYLVNCLMPVDTNIHITGQSRNANQSFYQLNFSTGIITVSRPGSQLAAMEEANSYAIVRTYITQGIRHILTGYDHLLFLCALVLGAAGLWDLIKIITAFTIAHSITLTLATFGLAHLPEAIVEPIIAGSIVFVAVQNIIWPKQANGNSRLAIAFFFGLFHGLGFAGGLLELMHSMPVSLIWYAILGFSLGVEAGNQLILVPLYSGLQLFKRIGEKTEKLILLQNVRRYASGAVAFAGIYYLVIDLCSNN